MTTLLLIPALILMIDAFLTLIGRKGLAQMVLAGTSEQTQRAGGAAFYLILSLAIATAVFDMK